MTNKSPQPPQNQFTQVVTQAVQTLHVKVNKALTLKPGAQVPQLWVQDADATKAEPYDLTGDRYILGRSSDCEIIVRNPIVSQKHLSLQRDQKHPRRFYLQDENSTNGIYRGRRRLNQLPLRHGDVLTLGPPELAAAVRVRYHNPPPVWVRGVRYALYGTGGVVGLLTLALGLEAMRYPVRPLPVGVAGPVVIYSRDQVPLRPQETQVHRELDSLREFSPYLPQAVIASEDSRFHWHMGVDPMGIARAFLINFRTSEIREGASTVTQQLARSLFPHVGRENTLERKWREIVVALKLEAFYSKDQILRTYLNRVYLGVGLAGFEDAAQFYFEKSAGELTLSESATLVGILPAPNAYNPVQNYERAMQMRNRVISRMLSMGMVSEDEANQARRSPIEISPRARDTLSNTIAPYFYSYVFEELSEILGQEVAREGNFIIETGLDIQMQEKAETALRNAVNNTPNVSQGAIVTLDSSNGVIRSMVGGVDYSQSQFNRATQAQRQPGSTFKVFAYAAAVERGVSPYKYYSCAPITWQGQGYRGCERSGGSVNMYQGMAQSENNIALRVAQDAGLDSTVEMAQRLGIRSNLDPVPGLILGQSEVNVLEITGAYTAFANQGIWNRPHAIAKIRDANDCENYDDYTTCREIYRFEQSANANRQLISPAVANTMHSMLRGVVQGGTGTGAAIGTGEAGKTGTTNQGVDLWFIGYTPTRTLLTGIWLGNDDNTPTRTSSGQAAVLWRNYMSQVVR